MFTSFEFRNFRPSSELKNFSATVIGDLAKHSPKALSCLGAMRLQKVGENSKYVCNLELLSGLGVFFEESASTNPMAAIEGASYKLQRRLEDWIIRRRIAHA